MSFQSKITILQSVDSTNNYVATLLKLSDLVEGTVVMAYEQTNGRGQRGNTWVSGAGSNLTFTLFLKPTFLHPTAQFGLNRMVSVALIRCLKKWNIKAKIKWPNDILVDERKISGILIENVLRGEVIESSIIGIGLNVNQKLFPNDYKATSILNETGLESELLTLLHQVVEELKLNYDLLKFNSLELEGQYLNNLYGYQQDLYYQEKGVVYTASIDNIGSQGELILKMQDGSKQSKLFKQVQLLGKNQL